MTDLVICLSRDERTWPHLYRLIKERDWPNVFIVTDNFCKERFKSERDLKFIIVEFTKPVIELIDDIAKQLKNRFSDFEVALNLVSGTGKEHMAVLAALLRAGVGIRFVAVTKEGVREL